MIGRYIKEGKNNMFFKIKKGDNIIYYCTVEMTIMGAFKVVSQQIDLTRDEYWQGHLKAYKTSPIAIPDGGFLFISELLENVKFKYFPGKKFNGTKFMGKTAVKISDAEFANTVKYIKKYKSATKNPDIFNGRSNDQGLGRHCDMDIMSHEPTSEMGVVVLFSYFMKQMGFDRFEFVRAGFPDACAFKEKNGKYERVYIEFEYKASGFKSHLKSKKDRAIKCDYVVCWENDMISCPVLVIELKSEIKKILTNKT